MTRARRARRAGIAALLLWPLSYAWIPLAERSPGWVFVLVPLAEISSVVLGSTAVEMAFDRGVVRETLKQPGGR